MDSQHLAGINGDHPPLFTVGAATPMELEGHRNELALLARLAALGTASGFGFRVQAAQFRGRVSSLRGFLGFGDLGRGEQAAFGLRQRNLP